MDAADRELLTASVDSVLDGSAPSPANDRAVSELGWSEMLDAEPVDAVAVVFAALGRAAARSGLLDDVVGATLGIPTGVTVVHPPWGGVDSPSDGLPVALTSTGTIVRARADEATEAHVVRRDGVATMAANSVEPAATHADGTLAAVRVNGPVLEWTPHDDATFERTVTAVRRAQAHELHGLAAGMLALAREHAIDRIQFGRPIGSFQAVRHKLAEVHVAVEAAGEALVVATAADADPVAVDLARVLAGRAAADAGRHCQQVLAGIGFTRDHDFHRYLFAAIETDGLYGTTSAITKALGRRLLDDREVPRVVDL